MDSINSEQHDTPCLPYSVSWDDYLIKILCLFVDSCITCLGDTIDDIHLLFSDHDDPSSIVVR